MKRRTFPILISLLAYLGLLTVLLGYSAASQAFVEQLISSEKLQAIETVHKRNIGQLHALHHDMRVTLKRVTDPSDYEATQQLAVQLRSFHQVLDTVAETEKDHPQWVTSWSQRHARVVVLAQEMEGLLLTAGNSRDRKRQLDQLGRKLQEMKEILEVW